MNDLQNEIFVDMLWGFITVLGAIGLLRTSHRFLVVQILLAMVSLRQICHVHPHDS